jgi:hypothetical protein
LIGLDFIKLFRAELKNPQYKVRFGLLLEAYLRYCGEYAEDLGQQVRTVDKLTFIAEIIQNSTHDELYNQVRSFAINKMIYFIFLERISCSFTCTRRLYTKFAIFSLTGGS